MLSLNKHETNSSNLNNSEGNNKKEQYESLDKKGKN